MIDYIAKMPGAQHQLRNGRGKPYTAWINGVNAVRLLQAYEGATLDQLTVASGEGQAILERSLDRAGRRLGFHPAPPVRVQPRRRPDPRSEAEKFEDKYFQL